MTQEHEDQNPFSENIAKHLIQYKKGILYGLSAVVILSALLGFWLKNQKQEKVLSYLNFEEQADTLQKFKNKEQLEQSAQLFTALPKQQAHHAKYLAQVALSVDEQKLLGELMVNASDSSTLDNFPFYQEYSKISLLIAEGQKSKAAERSLQQHQKMRQNQKRQGQVFGLVLYGYNLLRIAFLHQDLKQYDVELAAWKDLEDILQSSDKVLESSYSTQSSRYQLAQAITEVFSSKGVSLKDYISFRKNEVNKVS